MFLLHESFTNTFMMASKFSKSISNCSGPLPSSASLAIFRRLPRYLSIVVFLPIATAMIFTCANCFSFVASSIWRSPSDASPSVKSIKTSGTLGRSPLLFVKTLKHKVCEECEDVRIKDYKITCILRGPWLVNTRVWIRVSKRGNCHLQKIGKINVHDVNKCSNFETSITSTKSTKQLRTSKGGYWFIRIIQRLKRCWQIYPGHTQAKCTLYIQKSKSCYF